MNIGASAAAFISALIQCAVGAYMLSDKPPETWPAIFSVKFVFAVAFFAVTNGYLTHKNFRDPNAKTRIDDQVITGFDLQRGFTTALEEKIIADKKKKEEGK